MRLVPASAPSGTRIKVRGRCFPDDLDGRRLRREGYGIFLLGQARCGELIGDGDPFTLRVRQGQARGYFTVPQDGQCFQTTKTARFKPGDYAVGVGHHSNLLGRFEVTETR